MASKKSTFFVQLGTNTFGSLNLDPEIYDGALATTLGLTKTTPTGATAVIVPSNIRNLKKTGKVIGLKLKCQLGEGEAAKFRTIPVICETAKIGTATGELANGSTQVIKLGNLVTRDWKIAGLSA